MADRNVGMLEGFGGLAHPQTFHHGARAVVWQRGEGHDFGKIEPVEADP
jgi:hypothetical protein